MLPATPPIPQQNPSSHQRNRVSEPDRFRERHFAFVAPERAAVRAAVSVDAEVLHEPRVWPEYYPGYYGAFVRDPDGNNVEAVCRAPG